MKFIPILSIFLTALISRKATKTWFSPSSFFSTSWLFFTLTPIIFAPDFLVQTHGLWFISLCVMSCACGSIFALNNNRKKKSSSHMNLKTYNLSLFLNVLNFVSLISLSYLVVYSNSLYSSVYNYYSFLSMPSFISLDRYSGQLNYPLLLKYSLYSIYPSSIIGGIIFAQIRKTLKIKFSAILPLVFGAGLGLIEGARTSILLTTILFISTYLGSKSRNDNGKLDISSSRIAALSTTFILLFICFFIAIQWLREGLNEIYFELMVEKLRAYFFGYLSAFTNWFESCDVLSIKTTLSTFAGPLSLFGILDRELGFYDTININNYVSTNIYTIFRSVVSDFTIPGSILIFFLLGAFFQLEFQKIKKNALDGIIPISIFYSFTLYSPLISIFHYNSIFFSWFLVYLFLKMKDK